MLDDVVASGRIRPVRGHYVDTAWTLTGRTLVCPPVLSASGRDETAGAAEDHLV